VTIKIGYAGPMAGDYAAFGTDISQGGMIAVEDFGEFEGWQFELLTEDTQGAPEGGAAVANLYVSNPEVVAIAGHTFSDRVGYDRYCGSCGGCGYSTGGNIEGCRRQGGGYTISDCQEGIGGSEQVARDCDRQRHYRP